MGCKDLHVQCTSCSGSGNDPVWLAIAAVIAFKLPVRGRAAIRATRGEWRKLFSGSAYIRLLIFTLLAYFFLICALSGDVTVFVTNTVGMHVDVFVVHHNLCVKSILWAV